MDSASKQWSDLSAFIEIIRAKYIAPHLGVDPAANPSAYDLDVRAYLLLAHAAIEQFIEQAALLTIQLALKEWSLTRTQSNVLLALMCAYPQAVSDAKLESSHIVFDRIRKVLDEAKSRYSKTIHNNHGISLDHIEALLPPAGLDYPRDPKYIASLEALSKQRGAYAHSHSVTKIPSPEDALALVRDCTDFCDLLHQHATKIASYITPTSVPATVSVQETATA